MSGFDTVVAEEVLGAEKARVAPGRRRETDVDYAADCCRAFLCWLTVHVAREGGIWPQLLPPACVPWVPFAMQKRTECSP